MRPLKTSCPMAALLQEEASSADAAMVAASFIVLGFIATYIPQFLLCNAGMPRRYYMYPERFQGWNVASTAGASLTAWLLAQSVRTGS